MTKQEILKEKTDKFRTIRTINKMIVDEIETSVHDAMEVYAKQEAFEYHIFKKAKERLYSVLRKMDNSTDDELWDEYQISKLK